MPYLNKIIALIALVASLIGIHMWDKQVAVNKAKEEVTLAMQSAYQKKFTELLVVNLNKQKEINNNSFLLVKEKNETIKNLNGKLSVAINSLQQRTSRSTSSTYPIHQTITTPCTGRELYLEDGEFLTREAYRAEALIIERDYYYNEYENVRKQLNEN